MKIQCRDGIFDTGTAEFSQYNAKRMLLEFVSLGREGVRAGKPQYKTPCTVENAKAVLDAQIRKEQRIAAEAADARTTWLTSLTDAYLLEQDRVALGADMVLSNDLYAEMERRGLIAKRVVTTNPDFAKYVEAKNQAAREGRASEFKDGIN